MDGIFFTMLADVTLKSLMFSLADAKIGRIKLWSAKVRLLAKSDKKSYKKGLYPRGNNI